MEVQELAQLVKGLPHKLEDLNSIPRTQVKKGRAMRTRIPELGRQRQQGSRTSLARQFS